jgi:hypothetical protein
MYYQHRCRLAPAPFSNAHGFRNFLKNRLRMQRIREHISLAILIVVYLLASVRYFPGRAMHSMVETLIHMLSVAPINLGATLLIVALLQYLLKERLLFSRIVRIFFVVAISLEFILGLAHFFEMNRTG